jgi:hypothetical protein
MSFCCVVSYVAAKPNNDDAKRKVRIIDSGMESYKCYYCSFMEYNAASRDGLKIRFMKSPWFSWPWPFLSSSLHHGFAQVHLPL